MDYVEHFRSRKIGRNVHPSDETKEQMEQLRRHHTDGHLYGSDLMVSSEPTIKDTLSRLVQSLALDIKKHAGLPAGNDEGPPTFVLTYNGTVHMSGHVPGAPPYICWFGLYDFDSGACFYYGIGRCPRYTL
jgi:hypothetical protein